MELRESETFRNLMKAYEGELKASGKYRVYAKRARIEGYIDICLLYTSGREDRELIQFHRDMIAIHKENRELIEGSLKFLANDYQLLCYGRFTDREKTVVAVNNSDPVSYTHLDVYKRQRRS